MKKKELGQERKQRKDPYSVSRRPASQRLLVWLGALAIILLLAVLVLFGLQKGWGKAIFPDSSLAESEGRESFDFTTSSSATEAITEEATSAATSRPKTVASSSKKALSSRLYPNFDPESVASLAYCLLDAETGEVLATKEAEKALEPASLCKIMTAMLVLEHYTDLSASIEVCEDDLAELAEMGASVAGLPAGTFVSVEDILYAIMLPSGADACHAAARAIAGSQEAFVELMNQKARDLGMTHTHFTNPTGLPDPELYSTAADMARLMAFACKDPQFVRIAGSNYHEIAGLGENGEPLGLVSTFFWKFNSSPDFQGIRLLAGKSGFTGLYQSQASYFEKGRKRYILVTLGAYTEDPGSHQAVEDHILIMNQLIWN